MNFLLIISTILISLALVFYSIGVWAEKLVRNLKTWHVITFWTGFLFDLSGTYAMHLMSKDPFNFLNVHTLTGQIAIWLMFAHAVWATVVVLKGTDKARKGFHKYSLIVWLFWLIPYFGGMFAGMFK